MPWETKRRWVEPKKEIEVIQELPEGVTIYGGGLNSCRMAYFDDKSWYECKKPYEDSVIGCGGWIEGRYETTKDDTIDILCGRKGRVHRCRKCGKEVGFDGSFS